MIYTYLNLKHFTSLIPWTLQEEVCDGRNVGEALEGRVHVAGVAEVAEANQTPRISFNLQK